MQWSRSWGHRAHLPQCAEIVSAKRKLFGLTVVLALAAANHSLLFSAVNTNAATGSRAARMHAHVAGASLRWHSPSWRPLVQVRATDEEASVSIGEFMLGTGCEGTELDALATSLAQTTSDKLWDMTDFPKMASTSPVSGIVQQEIPKYQRWMSESQFQAAAKRIQPSVNAKTVDTLFKVLAGGNGGFIMKDKVDGALQSWGGTSTFNAGAFQASMLGAKLNIGFAYWFLNIFAPFCTYFFFLRPPLLNFLGIDLLPGLPKWWMR